MTPPPKKSLGQHWLFDSKSLGAICDAADITSKDTVLEIGPGLGTLTTELTARAKQVIAIELDEQLARELPNRVTATNLQVIQGDIVTFNLSQLPANYKVVANVPYYVTSKIVRLLLESATPPRLSVLLVQKEVAQRLAAEPGDMSVLSVSAQLYAHVTLGPVIPAHLFAPPPKVDSQVVRLTRRRQPLYPDVTLADYMRVVKAGFGEKRKTLRNALSGGLRVSKDQASLLLAAAQIDPGLRAEALPLEQWYLLLKAYQNT